MSDWLASWRSKWEAPSADPPGGDFLSSWRQRYEAPDDSEDWETLGAIQRNRKTGETRPRPQPGALRDTEIGVEDVKDTAAGGRSVLLSDMAKAGILNNAWGPFVGVAERVGLVDKGARAEIRTAAEEARDRYLQAHPEGGIGRAALLAAGEVAMGLPGPGSLLGAGAGALGGKVVASLGGGALAGKLAAAGAGALEQGAEGYMDAIDLPLRERLLGAAIGGGLGLAGDAARLHGESRGAYTPGHGGRASEVPNRGARGPGRPEVPGGDSPGGSGLLLGEQAAVSDLARAGRSTRAPLLTGAGDEVPLPSGVVFRGQGDAADAPWTGPERLGAHLPGFHVTEDESLATQFASGYGERGRVASGEVAVERPFSLARRYSYDELRSLDPDAALAAAKLQGIAAPDEPIDGGLFWKALRDQELAVVGGDASDPQAIARALRLSRDRLAAMGFDAVHHEVGAGKSNAWALIGDRGFSTGSPEPRPGIKPRVFEVSRGELDLDPRRFQYKDYTNERTGTGEALSDVRRWDPNLAGVLHVWEDPADLRLKVVNGHHRIGNIYDRTGAIDPIAVMRLEAATAEEARGLGALINIAEGHGSSLDAAKFLRSTEIPAEELAARGVSLKGGIMREGLALSKLDDGVFNAVAQQKFPAAHAAIIGEVLPDDRVAQRSVAELVAKRMDAGKPLTLEATSELAQMATGSSVARDSFTQAGLFGEDFAATSLLPEKAQINAHISKTLGREGRLFGTVAKERNAGELGRVGNRIDVNASREAADSANQAAEVFGRLKNSAVLSSILDEHARRLHDGESPAKVLESALNASRRAMAEVIPGAARPDAGRVRLGDSLGDAAAEGPGGRLGGDVGEDPDLVRQQLEEQGQGSLLGIAGPALGGLPDLGRVGALLKAGKEWVRRTLTNYGDFAALGADASAVAERTRLSQAERAAHEARAAVTMRDFEGALKRQMAVFGEAGIARSEQDVLSLVTQGLEGKTDLDALTPELREVVGRMRSHLDELTGGLLNDAQLTKDLRHILDQNRGKYLRRTYEIHRDPQAWQKLVKEEEPWRWDGAKKWAAEQHPDWTPEQVEGYLNSFFQEQGEAAGAIAPRSDAFRIDKGVFKQRQHTHVVTLEDGEVRTYPTKEQAERAAEASRAAGRKVTVTEEEGLLKELEDFLGLHQDPRPRYAEAVAKMAHDLSTAKLLNEVAGTLAPRGLLFDQPSGLAATRIAGDTRFSPLAGRYTTPEVAAVVEGMTLSTPRVGGFMSKVYAVNALVRAGKTVGSPLTHVRNTLSWIPMLVANGHFSSLVNVPAVGKAALTAFGAPRLTMQGRLMRGLGAIADSMETAGGKKLGDVFRLDLAALRQEYEEGIRLGVVREGARSQETARYLGLLADTKVGKKIQGTGLGGKVVDAITSPGGALRTLYSGEDDVGKLLAWRAEQANLRWAMPDAGEDEIKDAAAKLVRDLYPTYSKASPGIRAVRDFPLLGDFPTFWAEIVRTSKNILKQGATELASSNPRLKVVGAKRLAGFGAVLAAPTAAAAYFRGRNGVTAEEQESLREFVPEWNRYADLVVVEKKGPGRYSLIDASYINPHQQFREGWNALVANGLKWDERVEAVFDQLASPFKDEGIVASALMDAARNRTSDGRQVYPEFGTRDEKAAAIAKHIGAKLEPGIASQGRELKAAVTGTENPKTGRMVDPEKLAYSFLTGTRQVEVDVAQKLVFQARDLQRARTEAVSTWKRAQLRGGATPQEKLDAKVAANEGWKRALDEMRGRVEAARKTGLSDYQIRRRLDEDSQLSKETINALLYGGYFEVAK